ncbi:MAG: OmpA family protein [Ignavibacterium sp.]|nr:OmpA family protein [Ignavibacterium sp.]MCX7610590.1 OmpA family protein [Ignavibacterium sp.]MDW8374162.1 flagellar motor protein MotB [Ignavibacteriales bacterium]
MKSSEQQAPIIIKKGKHGHGHHGGAWKVAYADFVTAMMALFIVLWVLGQDKKVIESVASYFRDPIGFTEKLRVITPGNSEMPFEADTLNINIKEQLRELEIQRLQSLGESLKQELKQNPEFQELADQINIEIVNEGLRIELTESTENVFFEVGTANLKPEAAKIIQRMAASFQKLPNKIIIEGHTDSRPYIQGEKGYSNFELSAERANATRRTLVTAGLDPKKIDEVRGYADTRLRDPNDPFAAVNRRTSLIIKFETESP